MKISYHIAVILIITFTVSTCTKPETSTSRYDPKITKNYDAKQLLTLHNLAREQGGKCGNRKIRKSGELRWNKQLAAAALRHSTDMAKHQFFAHIGSDKSNTKDRVNNSNYQWKKYGENLAFRQPTPELVFIDWLARAEHCRNILDKDFNEMGAAVVNGYWTVVFAAKR